jgi:hypothetical protein
MLAVALMGLETLELLLAAWLATRWHDAGLAWPVALAAVVALAFAWRALLVLATFPLGGSRWPGVRVWLAESMAFSRAYLAMTCAPLLAWLDRARGHPSAAKDAVGPTPLPGSAGLYSCTAGAATAPCGGPCCGPGGWPAVRRRSS